MLSLGERTTADAAPVVRPQLGIDDDLRQCLERIVGEQCGLRSRIRSLERRRCEEASSYPSEIVTAHLAGGNKLAVFFKDFGSSAQPKTEPRLQRDRELRVYRDLLADAGLGTATYLGSAWDDARERYWLFLEVVHGTPLAYCG